DDGAGARGRIAQIYSRQGAWRGPVAACANGIGRPPRGIGFRASRINAMFLKEVISAGWDALMRDRARSALTVLGIGWVLVSVVLLLADGLGLGGCVLNACLNMGNNVIV